LARRFERRLRLFFALVFRFLAERLFLFGAILIKLLLYSIKTCDYFKTFSLKLLYLIFIIYFRQFFNDII
jgi:hypothetical protein